jgi:hypothetical protein
VLVVSETSTVLPPIYLKLCFDLGKQYGAQAAPPLLPIGANDHEP